PHTAAAAAKAAPPLSPTPDTGARAATASPDETRDDANSSQGTPTRGHAGGVDSASDASRSPVRGHGSKQMLQGAARSALRALGQPPAAATPSAASGSAGGKRKGKGKAGSGADDEDAEAEDEEGHIPQAKGKGRGKGPSRGRAAVKTESAGGRVSADLDDWTEGEALASLRYAGKPLMTMRVADLKEALVALGLAYAGNQPELRMRLARRLCADLAGGSPGMASMEGFATSASSPGSGLESSEQSSAREARRIKRRTLRTLGKKGAGAHTKDCPIVIASDDEPNASDAADEAPSSSPASGSPPAADALATAAGASFVEPPPEAEEAEALVLTEALAVEFEAGPKSSMTVAELRRLMTSFGLKPKGRKKSDLIGCWAEAVKARRSMKEEGGEDKAEAADVEGGRRGRRDVTEDEDPEASVDGVRVADMKVATLKLHVERMGLKATGHLKADLQRCLRDALLDGHSGGGGHAPRKTGGRVRGGDEAYEKPRRGRGGRPAGRDPPAAPSAPPPQRKRAGQVDPSPAPAFPPDQVWFHQTRVSAMNLEEMREKLHELDMPSLRLKDDEVTHDLIDALVQRKAEAADSNPRKQAWLGRPVYMMRKAELADMLRHFDLDDAGKVDVLRGRFRDALRKWAADEIAYPASGAGSTGGSSGRDGGGRGAGSGGGVADPEETEDEGQDASDADEDSADEGLAAGRSSRRGGRTTRHTRTRSEDAVAVVAKQAAPVRARRKRDTDTTEEQEGEEGGGRSASASSRRGRGGKRTGATAGKGEERQPTDARGGGTRAGRRRRAGDEEAASSKRAASPTGEAKANATGSKGKGKASVEKERAPSATSGRTKA
ncbi:unnamed protein product, partial [Ectocarpus sp. 12 AP-2014]